MDVFGMGMRIVAFILFQKLTSSFGERNKERDLYERIQLRIMGWHVILLWECQLKPKKRSDTLEGLSLTLNQIFLKDRENKAEPYKEHQPNSIIAAEPTSEYGIVHKEK